MLDLVLYAVSTDQTRINLTGVHLEATGERNGLVAVGTDGHRLAVVTREFDDEFDLPKGITVPKAGALELSSLLGSCKEDEDVRLGTTEGTIKVDASKLRARFGELMRREIAETVADPGDTEDEIRALFHALESGKRGENR